MNTKNFFLILLFWINIQTFCFAQTNPYRLYYSTNLDSIVCIWDLSNDNIDTFKIQFQDPNDPNNYLNYGLKIDVDQFYLCSGYRKNL
ncbi:MAG: hypothetical protein KatS3mg035_2009 [Bacteroidia bacterium]|nr:MAG: hypothetical protein KatS3mg035_2009 [Bacteroidia bacterium]